MKPARELTDREINAIAKALYKTAGWDRPWARITSSGRGRWRDVVRFVDKAIRRTTKSG